MKLLVFLLAVAVCRGFVLKGNERIPTQDIKEPLSDIYNKEVVVVEKDKPKHLDRADQIRIIQLLKDVENGKIQRKELELERPFLIRYVGKTDNAENEQEGRIASNENVKEPVEIRIVLENDEVKKTVNQPLTQDEKVHIIEKLDKQLVQPQQEHDDVHNIEQKHKSEDDSEAVIDQQEKGTKFENSLSQKDLKDSKNKDSERSQKLEITEELQKENPFVLNDEKNEKSRMQEEIKKLVKEQDPSKSRDSLKMTFEDQSKTQKSRQILKETSKFENESGEKINNRESPIREENLSKDKRPSLKDLQKTETSEQSSLKERVDIQENEARTDLSHSESVQRRIETIVQNQNSDHERPSLLFPMGEMVTDMMLEQYHWYKTLVAKDIKDFKGLSQEFLREIVTSVPNVTKEVRNPTTLTVLYLKAVMEEVLNERLKCPAVVLDKVLIRMARRALDTIQPDYDYYMSRYMGMVLSGYLDKKEREQIVMKGYRQLHNEMTYKLMHYIVSRHLKDVYMMSQQLYTDFQVFFEKYINGSSTNVAELATLITTAVQECDVKCPVGIYLDNTNKYVYWDLVHQFVPAEGASITDRLESLIYREVFYVYAKHSQPFPEGLYRLMGIKMHRETEDKIERYIRVVSRIMAEYEKMLITKDAQTYLDYIDFIVDPNESAVIMNVVKTLGWRVQTDIPAREVGSPRIQTNMKPMVTLEIH